MNIFLFSFLITSVTLLIIFTLELWRVKTVERKYYPPRFVDKGYCLLSLVFLDLQGEDALAIKVIGNIHDNPELITEPFSQPHEKGITY